MDYKHISCDKSLKIIVVLNFLQLTIKMYKPDNLCIKLLEYTEIDIQHTAHTQYCCIDYQQQLMPIFISIFCSNDVNWTGL